MTRLKRKVKLKQKREEEGARKTLIYLGIGLVVLAVILGLIFA
jgi:hypothetical protein